MKIKRLVAAVLPVLMVSASAFSVINANGADGAVKIEVSSETVAPGSTFTLNVSVSDIPETGIQGSDFAVKYDSSLVSIDSIEAGALVDTGAEDDDPYSDQVPVFDTGIDTATSTICAYFGTLAEDPAYWMHGEGVMFTITGTVLSTAEPGSVASFDVIPVPRKSNDSADSEENSKIWMGYYSDITSTEGSIVCYDVETVSGTVTVAGDDTNSGEVYKGDANVDGDVTIADAVAVSAFVANSTKNPLSELGQTNGDVHQIGNGLNATDALTIQQYTSGIIKEWPES